ncbi:glycosyltransferase family 2 protein [Patescibacteria group bacterium]|nr:glycosyltransferase family 2 protein [Patescibacteria group bacterium]
MNSINFSIIIPNLNGAEFLPDCLNSLILAIKNCPQSKFEIILVDNASTDDSLNLAKKIYPQIKIIRNPKNFGFAKAINQGSKLAKYSWIVPCNNDIKLAPNWFKIMSQTIKNNSNISAFFGTIKNRSGDKIESTGLKFFNSGKAKNIQAKQSKPKTIWGGNGALIIYQKNIFRSLGGFDPDFFAYLEDVDFNLRLNQTKHLTLLVPSAVSFHLGGGTSQKFNNLRQVKTVQNWIYIIIKNYSAKQIWQNLPGIIEQRFRNLSYLLKNTPFFLWIPTLISVYGQIIIKIPVMLKKRHHHVPPSF